MFYRESRSANHGEPNNGSDSTAGVTTTSSRLGCSSTAYSKPWSWRALYKPLIIPMAIIATIKVSESPIWLN